MNDTVKYIRLENDRLSALVDPRGAQLQSLLDKQTGRELLWQGNPKYWPGKAPILFPVIGGMKDDVYTYEGIQYPMPRHGFAQNSPFEVETLGPEAACFTLSSDAETKQFYPFDFQLALIFRLDGSTLELQVSIHNTGEQPLFTSFGWHPGFMLQGINTGSVLKDYTLGFGPATAAATRIEIQNGFRSGRKEAFPLPGGELPLTDTLFSKGPVVLEDLDADTVEMRCDTGAHGIRMSFAGFPYLGLWTAGEPDKPFLCIEPWQGITDMDLPQEDLPAKTGIMAIAASQEIRSSITVNVW